MSPKKANLGKPVQQIRVLLLCNSKFLVQSMDAQLAIQTARKFAQNYLREFPFFHKQPQHNFPSENSSSWTLCTVLAQTLQSLSLELSLMKSLGLSLLRKLILQPSLRLSQPLEAEPIFPQAKSNCFFEATTQSFVLPHWE